MGFGYATAPDGIEWTVLTIGHLSANRFWGEVERVRAPLCTTTLIRTPAGLVVVDPGAEPERMPTVLHDQAGLRPEDIAYLFVTHSHADHRCGLEAFPHAIWLMAEAEIAYWRSRSGDQDARLLERIVPVERQPLSGLRAVATPGHTPGTTSLLFDWRGRTIAVVGDAVMTQEHFRARVGHTNSVDADQARASIERLGREADLIVPGHDNAFVVAWADAGRAGSSASS
jgi:glyoxylase-like metal-dependent hydrolase (beta-lactamase superfamily II)